MCSCNHNKLTPYNETVSQQVYAIKDTAQQGRYDLLDTYIEQLARLTTPPSQAIQINILHDEQGKRVALIPERFKDSNVIIVGSDAYDKLKKIESIAKIIAEENKTLKQTIAKTEEALRQKEKDIEELVEQKDTLEKDKAELSVEVSEKGKQILAKNITIAGILLLIVGYLYLKIKFKLPI
jgi:hypothetical protein